MNLKEFVQQKIESNKLSLDLDIVLSEIEKLKNTISYEDEFELFYIHILNLLGNIILTVDGDHLRAEMMGWLKVKKTSYNDKLMYFYRFETEDDYYYWLNNRIDIYDKLDDILEIRLLNFIEMSTFDFVSDGISNCKYKLFKTNGKYDILQKTGMITNDGNKFMKVIAKHFNDGNYYKPVL